SLLVLTLPHGNPGTYDTAAQATAASDPFFSAFGQDSHASLFERWCLYTSPLCRLLASLFLSYHLVFSPLFSLDYRQLSCRLAVYPRLSNASQCPVTGL